MKTLAVTTMAIGFSGMALSIAGCGNEERSSRPFANQTPRAAEAQKASPQQNAQVGQAPSRKRAIVLGDHGWELAWVDSSALPPDWNSDFKVVCAIPASVITGVFPEFSAPGGVMRKQLEAVRSHRDGTDTYSVEIDPDTFLTKRTAGAYPVSLPGATPPSEPHVSCTMILAKRGISIQVPEFKNRQIVYAPREILKRSIADGIGK